MRIKPIGCVLVIATALFLIVMGPFFTIWSLNVLFNLDIPWSFKTWVAVVWLTSIFYGFLLVFSKSNENDEYENE